LIGVGTLLDPSFTIADALVGNIIGYPGKLPDVFLEIEIEYYLLSRLLGVKQSEKDEN
jgi:translation initiation factor 2 subunit 3